MTEEQTNDAPETDVEAAPEEEQKIEGLVAEVTETGPCKVAAKVTVPKAAIDAECAKTFDELTPNAQIPGFRKGHAPRKLVERHYADTVLEDVKRQLIGRSWEQVRTENALRPLGDPDLSDDKIEYDEEKGLSYSLELEVSPTFELKSYEGLELTKPPGEVDASEVDEMLERLAKRNAVLEPVEKGKTKQDDVPVVDCDIKVGDEIVHSVSDQELPLAPDNWLRGLDAELWKDLLGKKAGESAAKTVTLPDTYQKEAHRGKDAEVTVTIKDIKRPKMPEINDDFAKDMLYEDLDALKTDVRERIASGKEQEARRALSQQVEEKLLAMVDFELPEDLMKRMTERNLAREKMNLGYRGASPDDIEKAVEQLAEGAQARTERDMRMYFVLQRIAEDEDISVSETELERRIQLMAQLRGLRPGKLREDLRREGRLEILRSEICDEKTIDFLIGKAKITEEDEKKKKKSGAKKTRDAKKAAPEPPEDADKQE